MAFVHCVCAIPLFLCAYNLNRILPIGISVGPRTLSQKGYRRKSNTVHEAPVLFWGGSYIHWLSFAKRLSPRGENCVHIYYNVHFEWKIIPYNI